jgi:hypothetical protein
MIWLPSNSLVTSITNLKNKKMRQRDYINNQIDRLEAKMKHIDFYASRGDLDNVRVALAECLEQLGDIRSSIERESIEGRELNKI